MKLHKWIAGMLKEYRWGLVTVFLLLLLEGLAYLAIVGMQKWIIDDVFMKEQYELLVPILLIFAGVFFAYALLFLVAPYLAFKNDIRMYFKLSKFLMKYLHKIPIKSLQNERTAKYVHYFTNDIATASRMIGFDAPRLVQQTFMAIALMIVIGIANLQMLLFMFLLSIAYVAIGYFYAPKLRAVAKDVQDRKSDLLIHLEEGISSTREVISYGRNDWEAKRYHELFGHFFKKVMDEWRLMNKQIISTEPIRWGASLLVLGYGGYELMRGNMTLGLFVILYQYSFLMMEIVNYVFQLSMTYSGQLSNLDRIKAVIDGEQIPEGKEVIEGPITSMMFEDLHFTYQDEAMMVIKGMSIHLPIGKKIAFVGTSGGGKSTISQLLIRFFEPTSGTILINGKSIQSIQREEWMKRVDIVFQDPYLLPDTIEVNLTLGREGITEAQLIQACQIAQIHDIIEQMPKGYQTEIGERGITLSGGQRQRIALARAFLGDNEILILDEATSALDLETERQIQKGLDELRQGRTTIIIAHRLSTVINADVIFVVDQGKVIEQGTHNELLVGETTYKKLVYAQSQLPEAG